MLIGARLVLSACFASHTDRCLAFCQFTIVVSKFQCQGRQSMCWFAQGAMHGCRYTTEETVDLLQSVGFRDVAPIEANGLNGADLLEVTEQELRDELGLTHFQVGGCFFELIVELITC